MTKTKRQQRTLDYPRLPKEQLIHLLIKAKETITRRNQQIKTLQTACSMYSEGKVARIQIHLSPED